MVSSVNDPLESLRCSVQALELNFTKVSKNFEHCFSDISKHGNWNGSVVNHNSNELLEAQVDSQGKGKVPIKGFWGIFKEKKGSNVHSKAHFSCTSNVNMLKKGRCVSDNSGKEDKNLSGNCCHFVEAASNFINGLLHVLPRPSKSEKNCVQKHTNEGKELPLECFIGFVVEQLNQFPRFDLAVKGNGHVQAFFSVLERKLRDDVKVFLGNFMFARVGGVPSAITEVPSLKNEEIDSTDLIQLLPVKEDHPDKKKLFSVQDFFRYTETEGKRFFHELDRDGDGQVTLQDLEIAVTKRKLPKRYADEFMRHARSHVFSKSFGWKQFLSLMEQKEPTILGAYTSLCLSKFGTLEKSEILASLGNAGLPTNEDNVVAMMRFLNADTEKYISYGHFRNFMLLLPSDRLQEDPRTILFDAAATAVVVPPPVELPVTSVLKSALAGGLSCAFSTAMMHPVDTVKTQVQASTTLGVTEVLSMLPQVGARGLYKGSIPAIFGQFSGHGLRMALSEVSKLILINVAPTLPELQVESIASFCSTFLGTVTRVPFEVLKQRLQAGLFDNVGEALVGTWQQDGLRGFFRGTGATLCRELPFYVAGTGLYTESKKALRKLLRRELEPWEAILVGALSGGLTAASTTPFDVIKTRMMTAPQGHQVTATMVAFSILRHQGPLGLFKGAVPRFFWIAPLGAMNFAGYELARKAMDGNKETAHK